MPHFSNLRIGQRLGLGIALSALLVGLMVWAGAARLGQVQENLRLVGSDRLPKILATDAMESNLLRRAVALRDLVIASEPSRLRQIAERVDALNTAYRQLEDQLEDTIKTPAGRAALQEARLAIAATAGPVAEAVRLGLADDNPAVSKLLDETLAPLEERALESLQRLAKTQIDATTAFQAEARGAYHEGLIELLVLGAASVTLLGLSGWLLARSITRPIDRAVAVSEAVAAGDLTLPIEAHGTSETARLLRSLKTMQDNLVEVVSDVRGNAGSVATASAQIAQGNSDLSSRTEQQASALQQTAASMEELMSTVAQNAENTRQADQIAANASKVALRGGEAVDRVVSTMQDISDSSKQVAEIVSVIEGISFQTNILALNAAVEAARAGAQGRGFAVVASEVRSLAQRAADAARQIKGLIATSVDRVDSGTSLVGEAGTTMKEVLRSIRHLSEVVGEIGVASREQSTGVAQIGAAVTQLDHATQQNAALVEESAAAAEALKSQAERLVHSVSTFRLESA